jgi:hypothetical protein
MTMRVVRSEIFPRTPHRTLIAAISMLHASATLAASVLLALASTGRLTAAVPAAPFGGGGGSGIAIRECVVQSGPRAEGQACGPSAGMGCVGGLVCCSSGPRQGRTCRRQAVVDAPVDPATLSAPFLQWAAYEPLAFRGDLAPGAWCGDAWTTAKLFCSGNTFCLLPPGVANTLDALASVQRTCSPFLASRRADVLAQYAAIQSLRPQWDARKAEQQRMAGTAGCICGGPEIGTCVRGFVCQHETSSVTSRGWCVVDKVPGGTRKTGAELYSKPIRCSERRA